jgi:Fe-S cluster assembly protein SufD
VEHTEPTWAATLRQRGAERFAALGFPTTRDEDWRFTPVGRIADGKFAAAQARGRAPSEVDGRALLDRFGFGHPEWPRLVFVNGRHAPELSGGTLPAGVRALTLSEAQAELPQVERHLGQLVPLDATPFVAQNTAHLGEGAVVHVAAGVDLPHPIHLLFVTAGPAASTVTFPRLLVVVEREARASLIESYVSLTDGGYFTNAVTEVLVAENAWVEHTRVQRESEQAYHMGVTWVHQARDSHYRNFTFAMGGSIARHDLFCKLGAANTEALMYGLYLGRGEQLVDNHTTIYHDHPDCRSWEVYKGVLDGKSHGVFNGKIFVTPEAQKTDAKQTNRALLLSETARVDTKPQLEIFADDVKCTHGATVGFLNDQMRFYLRSRGIGKEAADKHLTYAFCAEVMAEVQQDAVREELDRLVKERIGV